MRDSKLTTEEKDSAKGDALLQQKRLLALKTELKKETDKAQFALAAAKEKAQKAVDKKNEVRLDSKAKLEIAKELMQLADVSKKLGDDEKKNTEVREESAKKVKDFIEGERKKTKTLRKGFQGLIKD